MDFFPSLILSAGIGTCGGGDWYEKPLGMLEAELGIVEQGRHSISLDARHYSDIDDYDFGVNTLTLEYHFKVF